MKNRLFLFLILAFTTTAFGAGGPGEHGGSGGGDFFTSSEQQVVDSVMPATLLLLQSALDFATNFNPNHKFGILVPQNAQIFFSEKYDNTFAVAFALSDHKKQPYENIDFLKEGFCPGPDGKTHAGSVTYPNGKLRLCISLEKMTSIPKDYLVEEMAILLSHELTHIASQMKDLQQQELQAQAVQEWFSHYNKVRRDIGRFTYGSRNDVSATRLFFTYPSSVENNGSGGHMRIRQKH